MQRYSSQLALAVSASLALSAAGAGVVHAAPANDIAANAITLQVDTPTDGTTSGGTDDYQVNAGSPTLGPDVVYRFTAPGSGIYSIRVDSRPLLADPTTATAQDWGVYTAASLTLTPATPQSVTPVARANFTGLRSEEIISLTLAAGESSFIVVDQDTTNALVTGGDFTITVLRFRSEGEPNNSPVAAAPFRNDASGAAAGAGDADPDFFTLGTVASGSRIFAMVDAFSAPNTNFDLRVTTATDTLEYDDQDGAGTSGGSGAPVIAGTTVPSAQEIFLRVTQPTAAVEPYHIYAVAQPASASATVDAGAGHATTATAQAASNGYVAGSLASSGETDVYAVNAHVAGDVIFVALDSDPSRTGASNTFDGQLTLLDAAGNELVKVDGNVNVTGNATPSGGTLTAVTPESPGDALAFRAKDTSSLFVKVTGNTGGSYLLSIAINSNQPQVFLDSGLHNFASTSQGAIGALLQTVTVTGRTLTAPITVAVTGDFLIRSKSLGGAFFTSTQTAAPGGDGVVVPAEFEIEYFPQSPSPSVGQLSAFSTGSVTETASLAGDITSVSLTGTLATFNSTGPGTQSVATGQLGVQGAGLGTSPIEVTASANFRVSLSAGGPFGTGVTLTPDVNGVVGGTIIFVKYQPVDAVTPDAGTIRASSPAGGSGTVAVSGKIPVLSITGTFVAFTVAAVGDASAPQTITVTAAQLDATQPVTITAPAGFELRAGSSGSFTPSVVVNANGSGALAQDVEVRYHPTSGTTHSGDVAAKATSAFDATASVSGTVTGSGSTGGGGGGGGGGCAATGSATPAAALPWAMAAAAALALRGLRRRETRA